MNNAEIVELAHRSLANTYGCIPLAFERGDGAYLYDVEGNKYLDFFCGLAVTSLGHGHPRVIRAIKEQAEKLTHVSNVFHTEPMARLGDRLCRLLENRIRKLSYPEERHGRSVGVAKFIKPIQSLKAPGL